jgi:hypothetical protein
MATTAKFTCNKVGKQVGWGGAKYVYSSELSVVYGDNEENKKFFASTPSGSITLGTIRDDLFEVGKVYYVTFEEAPEEVKK